MRVPAWIGLRRLLPLPIVAFAFFGTTWNVFEDGSGDAPTLPAAADSALPGDTILVWPGEYYLLPGLWVPGDVHLISQGGPSVTSIANVPSFPAYRVHFDSSSVETLVEGFSFSGVGPGYRFFGTVQVETNHHVRNCIFSDLAIAGRGPALWMQGTGRVSDCEFRDISLLGGNTRFMVTGIESGYWSDVTIENCRFHNSSGVENLAVYARSQSTVRVRNCEFENLSGTGHIVRHGGASLLEVMDCLFVGNHPGSCVEVEGPGVVEIRGNTFVANVGTGIRTEDTTASILLANNVFAQNGAVTNFDGGAVTVACNVLWENGVDWQGIKNQTGMNGNVVADPIFCDPKNGVYTVAANSPCHPENSSGCGLIGAFGVACGTTSIETLSWSGIKALYR